MTEFNPMQDEEIKDCLEKVMKSKFYERYKQKVKELDYNYSYSEAARDTLNLFKELI